MSFATVQKTIEQIFSLFPFCAVIVYPNANYRKKVHGVVLEYVLSSRLPSFCVFNVVVNRSVYYPNIVVVFTISYHCTIFHRKCRKSLSKTTLMLLNLEIMDQTTPKIIHVSSSKLLGACVAMARYQKEFCRKINLLLTDRCTIFFNDKL